MSNETYDAVANGVLIPDITGKIKYVKDETQRDALKNVSPGQYVVAYGAKAIWQRTGEGTWVTVRDRRQNNNG